MSFWTHLQQSLGLSSYKPLPSVSAAGKAFLSQKVAFYRQLTPTEQQQFIVRTQQFLATTQVLGSDCEVTEEDRLLVAAGAIIPVWKFPGWHYINLDTVYLVPGSFNEQSEFGKPDSRILGLVGTGHLHGKMILSKPALHYGFSNDRDKKNVAIHEFAHLIEMADGGLDGFPEKLRDYAYAMPWLNLIRQETNKIINRKSNIRAYGATNDMEFFAVATEYFFERPGLMKRKHPEVYQVLTEFYQQDTAAISKGSHISKKSPCPCGSGKRYKRCCMPSR